MTTVVRRKLRAKERVIDNDSLVREDRLTPAKFRDQVQGDYTIFPVRRFDQDTRPFLKWAGGKRQLLPQLGRFYPETFGRYFEPFLGSGAVFFDLFNQGRLTGKTATLTDENSDLIGTYLRVRDSLEAIIERLTILARQHASRGRDYYYEIRDTWFNPARREWRARGGGADSYPVDLAAMMIYLNRTGYNGLFRLNQAGKFNVPAGRYSAPRIVDVGRLRSVSRILSDCAVEIREAPFDEAAMRAERGDLVYFDPPYAPLSRTASFRSYTSNGFSDENQRHLQTVILALAAREVSVLLSNSTAPCVLALYESNREVTRAGLRCRRIPARRAINSRAEGRGVVEELLVTNVKPTPRNHETHESTKRTIK